MLLTCRRVFFTYIKHFLKTEYTCCNMIWLLYYKNNKRVITDITVRIIPTDIH